jgi:Kef-type K+ transport system membrane component KefB
MSLSFLPSLPFEMSYPLLFGALLVAGMLGGEFARLLRLPRIIGYVVVGFIINPLVQAMQMRPLIEEARIFVDLALGLVLFDLGRRMDIRWMRRDWTLAAAGIAEGMFSFLAVFAVLLSFQFSPVQAGIAAVGLASLLKLPVILALLAFGLFARNDQRGYDLLNVNLAPVGRLLYIVLFVITGASLPLGVLAGSFTLALVVVAARATGKLVAVLAIAPLGGLCMQQALGLGLALLPMSSLPLLMLHDILRVSPQFEPEITAAVLSAITIMEILGPFAVQYGLHLAGESLPQLDATFMGLRPYKARA